MAQNIFGFDREPKTLSSQDSWGHGRERRRCCWIWRRKGPRMTKLFATRMTKKLALRWKQIRHLGTASTQMSFMTITSTWFDHYCQILLPKTAQGEQQQEKIMKTILKVTGTVNSCRLKDHNHSNKKKQQQVENNVNYLGTPQKTTKNKNNINYLGTVNSCNPKRSVTQRVAFSCSTEQNFLHLQKIQNSKTCSTLGQIQKKIPPPSFKYKILKPHQNNHE